MFKNIIRWLAETFGDIFRYLEKPARIANQIVNIVKEYVYSPVTDLWVMLDQSGLSATIIGKVKEYLPTIIEAFMIGENIISAGIAGNWPLVLAAFVKYIASLGDGNRGKWWRDLAAALLSLIHGAEVPAPTAVALTQGIFYKDNKADIAAAA